MPHENFWENRGFYSRFWGDVTVEDIEAKNIAFSSDPRCEKCRYQILDCTEVESFISTREDIVRIASNDIGMGYYLKQLSVVLVTANAEIRDTYRKYISTCLQTNLRWSFHICDTLEQANHCIKKHGLDKSFSQRSGIDSGEKDHDQKFPTKSDCRV